MDENKEQVELERSDLNWYCQTCESRVADSHVTFEETHDPRCGGCGEPVEAYEEAK